MKRPSDLKHITDMHGARIRHLEALLMSTGFHSMPLTAPFSWTGPTPGPGPFQPELPTQLEVMRPSPEPPVWPTGMIGYEPSPMDLSSNPVSVNFRRSSSLSTSESLDLQHSSPRDTQSPGGTGSDEKRGRQREKTRKGSAMDIQVSMDSMDLDPMFAGATRRNEEAGGMRW
jgi:hypothetical protein